uniref:Uncharacterized protein n=1 Tax=Dictyoglomus turgidum TaxID=513050 RepID=A0A7C3SQN4_9BACT
MYKIDVKEGTYTLNSGKTVTPDNLDDLTKDEIKELLDTGVSAWELLLLRKSNHNLVNSINVIMEKIQERIESLHEANTEILKSLENINKKLIITTKNGISQERNIGEVVEELWEIHKKERNAKKLREVILTYKYYFTIVFVSIFLLSFKFHNEINNFLKIFENYLLAGLSAGTAVTLILSIIKMVISKK